MAEYVEHYIKLTVEEYDALLAEIERGQYWKTTHDWFWNEYWPNRVDPSAEIAKVLLALAAEGRIV